MAALTAAVAASAASAAQADSLTVTAKPTAPGTQAITVQWEADNPGQLGVYSYDRGTPCPASYQYDDNQVLRYDDRSGGQIPQGSSSEQVSARLGRAVAVSHLCAFLTTEDRTNYQTATTVADSGPLTRWGAVAGFNVRSQTFYGHQYGGPANAMAFRFAGNCSDGTSGQATDGPCLTSGRIQATISKKLRKQLQLKSRTILDHRFSFIDEIFGFDVHWPASHAVAHALSPKWLSAHKKLPVTLKLITTAPLAKTVTAHGDLYGSAQGAFAATYPIHDDGGG